MSLMDDVSAELAPKSAPCKYARQLEAARSEDPDGAGELERAVESGAIKPVPASRILHRNGFPVAGKTVALHVARGCSCTA